MELYGRQSVFESVSQPAASVHTSIEKHFGKG